tara:strand:+ start:153 stop:1316 length:1164 start_codon:yes stop_codon:yes gene_type:complete
MKLFKSLLVAPATLGLLVPLSANASEVNLKEISNYSDIESIELSNTFNDDSKLNTLLAGGEGLVDDSYDSSFSSTTTASFSADFYLGAEDTSSTETSTGIATDNDLDDSIAAGYSFQIDLNTSFTGEDSLDISLDAGNASGGIAEFDGNTGGDGLTVDGVSYTFPVGGATVFVGDNTDGSALFTTACVYGGPSDTLDDCGNVNAGITGGAISAGASYDFGNGFTVATGVQTGQKVLTEESLDSLALNAAYIGDNYGVSLTYSSVETSITEEDTATAFNAYYTPEGLLPSVSAGYEIVDLGGEAASVDEKESVFLGLTWDEVGAGSLGVAVGYSNIIEGSEEEYMYEAYYSYPINDGMTITPLLFVKENATSGLDNTTGVMVKTSFSF